jgi:enoyl-CoA hydratase/carnithine racemase
MTILRRQKGSAQKGADMSNNSQIFINEYPTAAGQMIGRLTLNRPNNLNSLTTDMIEALTQQLLKWCSQPQVAAVVIDGNGDKAFCAGGDIRLMHGAVQQGLDAIRSYGEPFFANEYRLDYLIHTYEKPVVCWGSGIVMGGGLGLMAGASHRIVTPSSVLAMPEIAIGLFPDVGGSWFLQRMPGRTGLFAGLTGLRMTAGDALFCGLADRYLEEDSLPKLLTAMTSTPWDKTSIETNHRLLDDLLRHIEERQVNITPAHSLIQQHFDAIQEVTDADSPAEILGNIQRHILSDDQSNTWWKKAADNLAGGCPVSAHLVQEQLRRSRYMSLAEIFRMEANITAHCLRSPNFMEGVRALLLEKGTKPAWQPTTLTNVSSNMISDYFGEEWFTGEHPLANLSAHTR